MFQLNAPFCSHSIPRNSFKSSHCRQIPGSLLILAGVSAPICCATVPAVNDARVIQFVGNNCIRFAQQRLEQTTVRVKTRTVENRVLPAEKLAQLRLQLLVDALRAADEAHAGTAVPT